MMINVFVAFIVPDPMQKVMRRVGNEVKFLLKTTGKDEPYYHCTLQFIGRIDESLLPMIREKLKAIACRHEPIDLVVDDIGCFINPKKHCLKVIYEAAKDIPVSLQDLCDELYDALAIPLEGKTTPPMQPSHIHFTITKRLKNKLSEDNLEEAKAKMKPFSIPITINELGLYYCKDPDHQYYRPIEIYPFKSEQSCNQ